MRGWICSIKCRIAVVLLLVFMFLPPVHASELAGVSFPDEAVVGGKSVVLNGLGLRTATILKVKVYVIGLYLESNSSDAKAIIKSPQTKRLAMHFVHDVTADKLRDGWKEGFDANYKDVDGIKGEIEAFNASMRDVKKGDSIVLDFHGDTVEVLVNGTRVDTMHGSDFQQALLSIWLGNKPPNEGLKKGILGQ